VIEPNRVREGFVRYLQSGVLFAVISFDKDWTQVLYKDSQNSVAGGAGRGQQPQNQEQPRVEEVQLCPGVANRSKSRN
jgi:hypothetical protein